MRDNSDLYYYDDDLTIDPNDYTLSHYIQAHIFWGLIIAVEYWILLFRCVSDCDVVCSAMIMAGIVIIVCMIGIFFQHKNKRQYYWMIANLSIGFGIYTVITYIRIKTTFISILLILAGALTLLNAVFICIRRIRRKKRALRVIVGRIKRSLIGGWGLYGGTFMALVLVMAVSSFFGGTKIKTYAAKADAGNVENATIGNSMDVLINLDAKKWEELDQQERLNVLQRVVDIERNNMGITYNIPLYAEEMDEEAKTGAYYSDSAHSITVNLDSLMNSTPYYLCNAMCHETRHAEQYIMISIYDAADRNSKKNSFFDQTVRMKQEFADYTSVEDNYYQYYGQECERDARSYAEGRAEVYFDALNEYLCENAAPEIIKGYKRTVDEAGNWSIVNGDGKEIFTGAEKINDLHEGLAEVTAVVDGRAMIISLPVDADGQVSVKKAFDTYRDITDIIYNSFAIVTDMEGNEGVVDLRGKVIIPTDYARIVYREQYVTEDGRCGVEFSLRQSDQTGDIIVLEFDPSDMTAWADLGE